MKKKYSSKSGFVNSRNLTVVLLCAGGLSLAMLSFASMPASQKVPNKATAVSAKPAHPIGAPATPAAGPAPGTGTLSVSNPQITYTDPVGPVPNLRAKA